MGELDDSLVTTTQSAWGAKPQALVEKEITKEIIQEKTQEVPINTINVKEEDIGFVDRIKQRIREEEGLRLDAYRPVETEEHLTQGYGRYGSSIQEGSVITKEQAEEWLDEDVAIRLKAINKKIPQFKNLPPEAKDSMFSSWYRGGLSGSPATIRLINKGSFDEAATEFLNNDEYRRLKRDGGLKGVTERMERVSEALRELSKNKVKTSDQINHFMQGE